jgi:predicted AAA+ superfamily ATPase
VTYELRGLSFREFLMFEGIAEIPALTLADLVRGHVTLAREVISKMKVLANFDKYLTGGFYPFYLEPGDGYDMRIRQMVNQVLESDYPSIEAVTAGTIRKVRRMLMLLSEKPPQTPNISVLARELEVDRNQCVKMMYALERAGLLNLLSSEAASLKNLSRPEKIYCENPNLMRALVPSADRGTLRECFALNQLRAAGEVTYPSQGDFLVNGKVLFEVGGKGKSFEQIRDLPDSYLAVDDLEIGDGSRIPLWCLGFLY